MVAVTHFGHRRARVRGRGLRIGGQDRHGAYSITALRRGRRKADGSRRASPLRKGSEPRPYVLYRLFSLLIKVAKPLKSQLRWDRQNRETADAFSSPVLTLYVPPGTTEARTVKPFSFIPSRDVVVGLRIAGDAQINVYLDVHLSSRLAAGCARTQWFRLWGVYGNLRLEVNTPIPWFDHYERTVRSSSDGNQYRLQS